MRCRLNSSKPNFEISPNEVFALSADIASSIFFSTERRFFELSMSIKSTTINPPKFLKRNCLATSSAASKLVLNAVASMFLSCVDLPELTSIATRASVGIMTSDPPEGNGTCSWCKTSI